MPNRYDVFENILLGYDHAEGYLKDTYYMGATVGRFANRIHQSSFSIEGDGYKRQELWLEFKAKVGKKEVVIPAVKVADGVISTSFLLYTS